ncbi:hypothetical protein EUX98_g8097 [Antrodiella citrinella]|uniref:Cyclase n=1 Tax=Antrodiella citrinella TaxID=2447956 RepID=A0A4S4MDY2_9APHY|nr:hypothetical protein EUX98_g8097 [Antrodiella citrinella]
MGAPDTAASATKLNGITPSGASTASSHSAPTVYDLSHPLTNGAVPTFHWSHPSFCACEVSSVAKGDVSNVHSITIGTHTGTHIDAPYHFFADGTTVDKLDLTLLTAAPAVVVDVRRKQAHEMITWEDLRPYAGRMGKGVAVLLCTGWSKKWNQENYSDHPFLDPVAAKNLMEIGVRVVGVDAMSPDEVLPGTGDALETHKVILGNGGVIVENLVGLERVVESGDDRKDLRVSILPLSLTDCDGSPVRAVAWAEGEHKEAGDS